MLMVEPVFDENRVEGCPRCQDSIYVSGFRSSIPYPGVSVLGSVLETMLYTPPSYHTSIFSTFTHSYLILFRVAEPRPTYYERFKQAFVTEVNEFTAAVLDDKRELAIHIIPISVSR